MKASVKLRPEDHGDHRDAGAGRPPPLLPLLQVKVPVTILGLPFISFASGGDDGLSLQLRTDFPAGPSFRLSYHPESPSAAADGQHPPCFSISLKSGLGLWGSPKGSPLLLSARLPLGGGAAGGVYGPSFSVQISTDFGDFAFKRSAPVSSLAYGGVNPNPPNPVPKENGGGIYRPLPVGREEQPLQGGGGGLLSASGIVVRTTVPVSKQAALKLRWGVNFPSAAVAAGGIGSSRMLPFLTVDNISIENIREDGGVMAGESGADGGKEVVSGIRKESDSETEALTGMCFWMTMEAEDLRKEQLSIREGIDELRSKFGVTSTAKK